MLYLERRDYGLGYDFQDEVLKAESAQSRTGDRAQPRIRTTDGGKYPKA